MKKLFVLVVTATILFSCGNNDNSTTSDNGDSNYKYVYNSGYSFNDSLFAIINNIQMLEDNILMQENTGKDMEQIRQKVSDMLVEGIEKVEQTKPYYEGEDLKNQLLVVLKLKQKHIDNNWKTICELVGDTKIIDISEDVFNQINVAITGIETAENTEVDVLAGVQNVFAGVIGTYVETAE